MNRTLLAAMTALILLGACGTRLNPMNWFNRSVAVPTTLEPAEGYLALGDNRILVDQVTELNVKAVPSGAIVQATGLPPTQGWWDTELVADNDGLPDENGVLTYRFVVAEPRTAMPANTQQSREVTAGVFVSSQDLAGVNKIVVAGERGSRAAGR